MNTKPPPPLDDAAKAKMSPAMIEDYNRWREKTLKQVPPDWHAAITETIKSLPESVEIPFEKTPEGERRSRFEKAFDPECEFLKPIDRRLLKSPAAFDRVAGWEGKFAGPLATGPTGTAKTRAAFAAIERLFVRNNRAFIFFPVKRLISEFQRYEKKDITDDFYRMLSFYPVLLVDDVDKINWQFESEASVLFQFYDWVYRSHRPVITTTNHPRAWWIDHTGAAFTRRLFDEAHFEVKF